MAKKRTKARKKASTMGTTPTSPKPVDKAQDAMQIRGSAAWKEWVHELAEFTRDYTFSRVVDRALAELARIVGFTKQPPKR